MANGNVLYFFFLLLDCCCQPLLYLVLLYSQSRRWRDPQYAHNRRAAPLQFPGPLFPFGVVVPRRSAQCSRNFLYTGIRTYGLDCHPSVQRPRDECLSPYTTYYTQCRPSCFIPQFIFFFHRDTKKQTNDDRFE